MSRPPTQFPTLAPVVHVPCRARHARTAFVRVSESLRIPEVSPHEARTILVHEGQGRSAGRPIVDVGGGLFTPVMRWAHEAQPDPLLARASADAILLDLSEGRVSDRWDFQGATALSGTPLLARNTYGDERISGPAVATDLTGSRIVEDGRDAALSELRRFVAEDLRIAGDDLLVRMGSPLVHLHRDRLRLVATLNPALANPREMALPAFFPFGESSALIHDLLRRGIAKGPVYPLAPHVSHLDDNGRAPVDLLGLPRREDDAATAARATALAAPGYALESVSWFLRSAAPGTRARAEALRAPVMAAQPWTRFGYGGPYDLHQILTDAVGLVEAAIEADASLMRWHARSFCEVVRARHLPALASTVPDADADALGSLAP